jgi:terminal uridylyltransferase
MQLDPNAFQRGGFGRPPRGRGQHPQQLFNPNEPRAIVPHPREQQHAQETRYLQTVAATQISNVEMSAAEYQEKESFRATLEGICVEVCSENPDRLPEISLEPFGSFKSGFATAGSDMDLVIVIQDRSLTSACFSLLEDDLPRVLEKKLLERGFGARLLTRTRVPIIKVCEKPDAGLITKLREEREKWDGLPAEEKYPHLFQNANGDPDVGEPEQGVEGLEVTSKTTVKKEKLVDSPQSFQDESARGASSLGDGAPAHPEAETAPHGNGDMKAAPKLWTRERKAGPLDFPKSGVGIQSDINFFNPLGLHNTQLLRCYSLCDPRVRPMVLFVKAWAKHRKINSSYSGTLSSYGYVLMVLHFLTNIANPSVLSNLQADRTPLGDMLPEGHDVDGWHVRFWRNEAEITNAAQRGQLSQNRESLGSLLAGFFHYYSSIGGGANFHWMQEILSLRSYGGLLTKEEKGWVRAVTEEGEGKKIQHRYLFCIEDPFELSHNVARTVTHKGIVAIRDEFRRAHRILVAAGMGQVSREGELFAELIEAEDYLKAANELKSNTTNGKNSLADGCEERNSASPSVILPRQFVSQPLRPTQQHGHLHQTRPPSRGKPHSGGHRQQHGHSQVQPKSFNIDDNDAFPSLGGPGSRSTPGKKKVQQIRDVSSDFSEISGDKARAVLDEVKRKKDEAAAETTATLAAESVLDGDD